MKVYLVGHTISPNRGSEPGNTWNWAWELSRHIPVTVLAHPHYRAETEAFLSENPNPRLKILWVELQGWDPWNPSQGEKGIRLHYLLWLRAVRRRLQELLAEEKNPDRKGVLLHHVSWNTISAPPPLLGLGAPAVWGPVGGGQKAPQAFLKYWGGKEALKETLRSWRLAGLTHLPWWQRAVRGFDLILATNRETQHMLERAGARALRLFLDCGTPRGLGLPAPPGVPTHEEHPLVLLWAGRMEPIKGFPLALEALARVRTPVELWVAGDGPMLSPWKAQADSLGLVHRVRFLGWVPWTEMATLFIQGGAFLFTSLRDSSGSVVLEAMAFGLPVIVPDHQGVGTFVPENAGIKVPVTKPEETVAALAQAIERLAQDPTLRARLGQGAWRFAQEERWERRAEVMLSMYEEVLQHAHRLA